MDSSPRTLTNANWKYDAVQVKALVSCAPKVCRHSIPAASSTPPITELLLSATKKWKDGVATFLFACLHRGRVYIFGEENENEKYVTCNDGFDEGAACLGAWCGLGAGWEGVWAVSYLPGVTVHSSSFLLADPLALLNFYFIFPPRVQHKCLPVNS